MNRTKFNAKRGSTGRNVRRPGFNRPTASLHIEGRAVFDARLKRVGSMDALATTLLTGSLGSVAASDADAYSPA